MAVGNAKRRRRRRRFRGNFLLAVGLLLVLAAVALAGCLEAAQGLTASRHGRVIDFLVKGGAAMIGALAAQGLHLLLARRTAR